MPKFLDAPQWYEYSGVGSNLIEGVGIPIRTDNSLGGVVAYNGIGGHYASLINSSTYSSEFLRVTNRDEFDFTDITLYQHNIVLHYSFSGTYNEMYLYFTSFSLSSGQIVDLTSLVEAVVPANGTRIIGTGRYATMSGDFPVLSVSILRSAISAENYTITVQYLTSTTEYSISTQTFRQSSEISISDNVTELRF